MVKRFKKISLHQRKMLLLVLTIWLQIDQNKKVLKIILILSPLLDDFCFGFIPIFFHGVLCNHRLEQARTAKAVRHACEREREAKEGDMNEWVIRMEQKPGVQGKRRTSHNILSHSFCLKTCHKHKVGCVKFQHPIVFYLVLFHFHCPHRL